MWHPVANRAVCADNNHNLWQGDRRGIGRADASAIPALPAVADGFCFSHMSQGSSSRERPGGTQASTSRVGSCRCHRLWLPGRTQTVSAPDTCELCAGGAFRDASMIAAAWIIPDPPCTANEPRLVDNFPSCTERLTPLPDIGHLDRSALPRSCSDLHKTISNLPRQYSPEFRQRASRLLDTTMKASEVYKFEAIKSVASRLGIFEESVRWWNRRRQSLCCASTFGYL